MVQPVLKEGLVGLLPWTTSYGEWVEWQTALDEIRDLKEET